MYPGSDLNMLLQNHQEFKLCGCFAVEILNTAIFALTLSTDRAVAFEVGPSAKNKFTCEEMFFPGGQRGRKKEPAMN